MAGHLAAIAIAGLFLSACGGDTRGSPGPGKSLPLVVASGVDAPLAARVALHVDTLHGVPVPDPYRWLEDTLSPEGRAWVARQEVFATAVLDRLVGRDSLTALFERAFRDAPTLSTVRETPQGVVLKRWLGDSPSLLAIARGTSSERMLRTAADITSLGGGSSTMREFVPSPDGRLLALGMTGRGDEGAAVSVVDATTGVALPDRIPDLLTTMSGTRYEVSWLPHEPGGPDAFFYPRLWPGSESHSAADRLARGRQFLHRIGTPQSADVAVFGYGVTPAIAMAPEDLATRVLAAPGSRWLVGSIFRARRNASEQYAARRTAGDSTVPAWVPLLSLADLAGYPLLHGDTAWVLARREAERGRILRRVLGDGPAPSGEWETAVPERRGVITAFAVQNDGVYFTERDAGAVQLHVVPHGETRARAVTLPVTGTVRLAPRSPALDGVLVSVESWATPPRWFRVVRGGVVVEPLALDDGGKAAVSPTIVSDRLEAPSRDGTLVPVSIVYDRGTQASGRLDGGAPLIIEAYGGFGSATDPLYDPFVQVWTSLGGVYAYAHVRGGGELGEAWHRAGTREHKQNSIDDVIGAVESLIAKGYTSAGRVAIQGISFGAIISGLAMLQRPDLFGVSLYEVGGPDEIRAAALDPSAARNIAEIGDVDTPEGIRLLRAASPNHVVPSRLTLPAVLLHSANDDYNFGTEMLVAKHVARLQAANAGDRPVVWVRATGGHRWLSSLSPTWAATVTSFLLWQTGVPRFQPTPHAARTP
ncbi:MAG: S9 family peptidase [Cytophagaceae bacterium]|nr:S9 family peptidase [Gemmatimonadaceae bacterium]